MNTLAGIGAATDGLHLFARYAYPPNSLGYCGPEDHGALFGYATEHVTDDGLVELARAFTGPWPYLTLLAGAAGIDEPFDRRLVEAYWVGNELLDRVRAPDLGATLDRYFRRRAGRHWGALAEAVPAGAPANHVFHVFGVYPWVGLLDSGRSDHPLTQLDRCRIRWGQVLALHGDQAVVRYEPLTWDGHLLGLGLPTTETVTRAVDGQGFIDDLRPGDHVSMHWHWICDRLDRRQLDALKRVTVRQLAITNGARHSGPGHVLAG